jgi:hypothetical protein
MSFDTSRFIFDHWKDYSGVVMQQGRVQTDADWNEWLSELSRRIRAGTLDTLGHAVYPATTPYAFKVESSVSGGKNVVNIGVGRMYVDGILVENHGDPAHAAWDPALEELSNTPQPAPTTRLPLDGTNSIPYEQQPFSPGGTVQDGTGDYLAFLDVWRRPITHIEDPSLIDAAIGIETTGRLQTAWRVSLQPLPGSSVNGSVTSGAFVQGEKVLQSNTGASAPLRNVPSGSSQMMIGPIAGVADGISKWIGQTSGAVYTPTAAPLGQYSTIAGAVTFGVFTSGEQVIQSNTNAKVNLLAGVAASGPMLVGEVSGPANPTDTWIGQTSGAVFTPSAGPVPTIWNCATPDSDLPWSRSSGQLSNGTVTSGPSGPCCLSSGTGYTGAENQFYRVEIHNGGTDGGSNATFKWSRENASVQTSVTAIATGSNTLGNAASILTVQSLGRDQVLGFGAGSWIEITNETLDDFCLSGELYQIDKVDPAGLTITLTTLLSSEFPASSLTNNKYTRITRWDQRGKIYKADNSVYYDLDAISGGVVNGASGIPVPTDGSQLILENGIVIWFGLSLPNGRYRQMDYWTFSARTATGNIDPLTNGPARGIHHHYTKLAIVSLGSSTGDQDCRTPWGPTSSDCGCGCCTATVGDGTTSFGMYTSIQQAVNALPDSGGEICILPGTFYEYVLLQNLKNVVVQGCEFQTQVFSPKLGPAGIGNDAPGTASASELPAVFTIVNCQNLALRTLAITAGRGEIGILIDRPSLIVEDASQPSHRRSANAHQRFALNTNISLEHLAIASSTFPTLLGRDVSVLRVNESLFTMEDVAGRFPAVCLSGQDIFFERNTVLVTSERILYQMRQQTNLDSQTSTQNLLDYSMLSSAQWARRCPGGVQIAGPSRNIFVTENTIEGGSGNGITLGSFILLDANGNDTGTITGVRWETEGNCSPGGGGIIPGQPGSAGGSGGKRFAAGGLIRNLHIDRNLIRNTGMSGIGPVGFFDMETTLEVISLVNVSIRSNVIARTLQRGLAEFNSTESTFGYGAITLPDVENLTVRDNSIIDFGQFPGAEVCGIFLLHAEGVEISRNQIRETRDMDGTSGTIKSYGGMRAGMFIHLVAPPTLQTATSAVASGQDPSALGRAVHLTGYETPVFTPGMPALRVQENVVRVALGLALSVRGTGPFSIVNNHFSSGSPGNVSDFRSFEGIDLQSESLAGTTGTLVSALTIAILNLGLPLEFSRFINGFSSSYQAKNSFLESGMGSRETSDGTVLFTNNICQLTARANRIRGMSSVAILTLDHLLFANNELWMDALSETAFTDALLFGTTLQAMTNRFQESYPTSVIYSAFSFAAANITSHNVASFCIDASGARNVINSNLVLNPTLCRDQFRTSKTGSGLTDSAKTSEEKGPNA